MTSVTTLHEFLAKRKWELEEIKKFLERDSSSINEEDPSGEAPLQRVLSSSKCSDDIIKVLLEHGADVNSNNGNYPPLVIAVMMCKSVTIVKLLLNKGADIDVRDTYGSSLLCLSFCYSTNDVIEFLLDAGCSLNSCMFHKGSVLRCATRNIEPGLDEDTLQLLIKKGAALNVLNAKGRSPLCYALGEGNKLCVIELLLKAGCSLNACQKHASPMHCATDVKDLGTPLRAGVVELLLKFIEKVSGRLSDPTPVQWALKRCDSETKAIDLLLDHLPDVNIVEEESNNSLLHIAVRQPNFTKPNVVKLLIKRGVKVDMVNENGDSALHFSVRYHNSLISIVRILIENGCPVNLKNASGENPLHVAAKYSQFAVIIKLLFCAGAQIGVTGYSLLKTFVDIYDPDFLSNYHRTMSKLDYCKMFMKCYFLENPDFDFQNLIQGHKDYEAFSQFGMDCEHELQKLDSKNVGRDLTLRGFLGGHSTHQQPTVDFSPKVKQYDFNKLLRIIIGYKFPLFFDIIAGKVGRSTMEKKLPEVEVYVYKNCSEERVSGPTKRVTLNGVCVHEIADRLGDEDLLRFISAFHKMDRRICATQYHEDKRRNEQYEQCRKHPRLEV